MVKTLDRAYPTQVCFACGEENYEENSMNFCPLEKAWTCIEHCTKCNDGDYKGRCHVGKKEDN